MTQLPEAGFLREKQILGNPRAKPPVLPIIPIAHSTWWDWIRQGRAPKPIRLSRGVTVWRAADIRAMLSAEGEG
jgi:predicted DNA-binding transcriptional regulator AlpA